MILFERFNIKLLAACDWQLAVFFKPLTAGCKLHSIFCTNIQQYKANEYLPKKTVENHLF
jgi:hypothetical protein